MTAPTVTRRCSGPRARRHPARRAARTPVALRGHVPAAADRRPRRWARAGAPVAPADRSAAGLRRPEPGDLDHRRLHLRGTEGTGGAPGVLGQLRARVPGRDGGPRRRPGGRRPERPVPVGEAAGNATRCTSRWRRSHRMPRGTALPSTARGAPTRSYPASSWSGARTATSCRPGGPRSASRTASANPALRAAAATPSNRHERPLKAGEIILGYPDETGELPPMPTPADLGRNGTYVVFRKLHTRVAAYRQYLRARSSSSVRGRASRRQDGRPLAERRPPCPCPRR